MFLIAFSTAPFYREHYTEAAVNPTLEPILTAEAGVMEDCELCSRSPDILISLVKCFCGPIMFACSFTESRAQQLAPEQ